VAGSAQPVVSGEITLSGGNYSLSGFKVIGPSKGNAVYITSEPNTVSGNTIEMSPCLGVLIRSGKGNQIIHNAIKAPTTIRIDEV
jgi:parallel beta-helix repeat protein